MRNTATPGATSYQATTAAYHVRRVVADEHGHGVGLGEHARPRPGARGADVADGQEGAEECVTHRAARCG